MAVAQKIGIVCLVTRVCLTSAILTAKASSYLTQPTNPPRPWHSYLPAAGAPLPKHPRYAVHAIDDDAERPVSFRISQTDHTGTRQSALPFSNYKQKTRTGPQRFPTEIHGDVWLSPEVSNASPSPPLPTTTGATMATTRKTTTTTTLSGPRDIRGYQRHVPRRFVYQDIEQLDDGYLEDEYLSEGKLPYRGKAESTYHRSGPQDITTAIKALDRFLSGALNSDGYNSVLHPPPNPILALVLSRYGRYVPGTRNPRVYAHMAVNNIHNNKPFGRYKYEYDEEPIYAVR